MTSEEEDRIIKKLAEYVEKSHATVAEVQSNQYAEIKSRLDNQDKVSAAFRSEMAPILKAYQDQQVRAQGYENIGNLAVRIGKIIGATIAIFAVIKYAILGVVNGKL